MNDYIKKSEAVDVIVKYPYDIAGKTATAIKMIEDLPSADVVPKSEVEKWYHEYHAIKDELKQEKMYHKETEKLVDKYCTELEKSKAEMETLKDNNEHLAVMLEEAKSEVERLQAEKDALIKNYAECMKDYASEIFAEIEKIRTIERAAHKRGVEDCYNSDSEYAELKKKYTEGEQ